MCVCVCVAKRKYDGVFIVLVVDNLVEGVDVCACLCALARVHAHT